MTFGTDITNRYSNLIQDCADQIAQLEQQLADLREQKKQIEADFQQTQTLIGAGQSALEQAARFISAAQQLGHTEILEDFWAHLEELKQNPPIAELPPAPEPDNGNGGNGHEPSTSFLEFVEEVEEEGWPQETTETETKVEEVGDDAPNGKVDLSELTKAKLLTIAKEVEPTAKLSGKTKPQLIELIEQSSNYYEALNLAYEIVANVTL